MSEHSPQAYVPATTVNAEAGNHPIAAQTAELAAARAATRSTWHEFPYYARRYGQRGWRFSLSDSGWITSLCSMSSSGAQGQIEWLGGLLAARGMPRYLLERHLHHLHHELVRGSNEGVERYVRVKECGEALQRLRLSHLPDEQFRELAASFDHTVAGCAERVANMGVVLIAAVIDERAGLEHAVERVASWACDAKRFSTQWRTQVERAFAHARAAVR